MTFIQRERMGLTLRIAVGQRTDPGRVRPENQDSLAVPGFGQDRQTLLERGFLLVVADGIGGEAGGSTASWLATQCIAQTYYEAPTFTDPATALVYALQAAHAEVLAQAQNTPAYAGMGTTAAAAVIRGDELTVAHAGDSRAYLIRDGAAHQLTLDHTWAAEQARMGTITPEEAQQHMYRHILQRFLGKAGGLEPEVAGPYTLQPGDVVVLCTDGLTSRVGAGELVAVVTRHAPQPAADALVDLVNQRGGPDNITIIVAQIGDGAIAAHPAVPWLDQRTLAMPAWLVHARVRLGQIPPWAMALVGSAALLVLLWICCIMSLVLR